MASRERALIVGAGAGLGAALARRLAKGGLDVALAAREPARLESLVGDLRDLGVNADAFRCDATNQGEVDALFDACGQGSRGAPALVIHNPSHFVMAPFLDLTSDMVKTAWRVACFGGFLVGRAAAKAMLEAGRGAILFTGSSPSIKAPAEMAAFAIAKWGVRALSQSMARELGPKGIHVAHVVIDGPIAGAGNEAQPPAILVDPAAIAEVFFDLYCQPRSAWTQEIDVRAAGAKF